MQNQQQKRIGILTENGFEQSELIGPKEALENAGYIVDIISPQRDKVRGWDHDHWGLEIGVDRHITDVSADEYDALVLPGGVLNPDKLRTDIDSVELVKEMFNSGKVIAAICHGAQTLIEARIVEGKKMTSYPSIRTDLTNAGALWIDQEVVADDKIITSRRPGDLPAFNRRLLSELVEGRRERTTGKTMA
jgi:protease I